MRGVGLQGRLLAGLAALVLAAVASAGWVTLRVARAGVGDAEEEQARKVAEAVAALLGRQRGAGPPDGARARMAEAAAGLTGVGGIDEVAAVDAGGRPLVGEPGSDAAIGLTLAGAGTITRRAGEVVTVHAALPGPTGARDGAVRVRFAVGATLDRAMRGSIVLLAALTLVDAALIVLFGALFVRRVVRPLGEAARAAARVGQGQLDAPPLAPADGELGALSDALNRMTAALREERARLAASRDQVLAQERLATVGRLAAGVAHEIGNPLTAVLGYVELLRADLPPGPPADLIDRVGRETERIQRIVRDLVDYARPVKERVEPVSLAEVTAAALDLTAPQPRFRSVEVERALPADLPPAAASAPRLVQVLLNLLINAADAGATRVRIAARASGGRVTLEVADDGPGVSEQIRPRLFEPFTTTKEPGAGTGLGLAVCRSIVGAFAGTIDLAETEKGATFVVTLPIYKEEV